MRKELRDILEVSRGELAEEIDIEHGLLDKLLERKVLTSQHCEEITSEKTTAKKVTSLIDILKRCEDGSYDIFREVLSLRNPSAVKRYLPVGQFYTAVKSLTKKQVIGQIKGLAWMDGMIFVMTNQNQIHVFDDQPQFNLLQIIMLETFNAFDTVALPNCQSLFVSIYPDRYILKIKLPGKSEMLLMSPTDRQSTILREDQKKRLPVNGEPTTLSTTPEGLLLGLVKNHGLLNVYIYRPGRDEPNRIITIQTAGRSIHPLHVAKSWKKSFVVVYRELNPQLPRQCKIQFAEMDENGNIKPLRYSLANNVFSSLAISQWYLAFDEDNRLFVVDTQNKKILLLDSELSQQILTIDDVVVPQRTCLVRDKQLLIVGQGTVPGSIKIFRLCTDN